MLRACLFSEKLCSFIVLRYTHWRDFFFTVTKIKRWMKWLLKLKCLKNSRVSNGGSQHLVNDYLMKLTFAKRRRSRTVVPRSPSTWLKPQCAIPHPKEPTIYVLTKRHRKKNSVAVSRWYQLLNQCSIWGNTTEQDWSVTAYKRLQLLPASRRRNRNFQAQILSSTTWPSRVHLSASSTFQQGGLHSNQD